MMDEVKFGEYESKHMGPLEKPKKVSNTDYIRWADKRIDQLKAEKKASVEALYNLTTAVRKYGSQGDIYNKALLEAQQTINKLKY